jgi:hypothetical protein
MTTHFAGGIHQLLNLALGQVATLNCEAFDGWCAVIGCLIRHEKSPSGYYDSKDNNPFLHSLELVFGLCPNSLNAAREPAQPIWILSRDFATGSGAYPLPPVGTGGGRE